LKGLGASENFGYIDFFPNGEKLQPGYPKSQGMLNLIKAYIKNEEISCSHKRASAFIEFFG
jgi:hypothetical protein